MPELLVGDAARYFKRSTTWLRQLELRGVVQPKRMPGLGYRIYTAEDLDKIKKHLNERKTA